MSARSVCSGMVPFMVLFGAGDIRAAETAGNLGFDSLGAQLHGAADGHASWHGGRTSLFQLLGGNVLGHQLGVQSGLRTSTILIRVGLPIFSQVWRAFSISRRPCR